MAKVRERIARWLGLAPRAGTRSYAAARPSRMQMSFGASGGVSADAALAASLAQLRARSRQMVRDSAYAKRAKVIVQNNVVGSGIGMQAQVYTTRDQLAGRVNDDIERAWAHWSRAAHCHTGGTLHFADLERLAIGQVFEAGEILLRKHYLRLGASRVPLALEVVEPERLIDDWTRPEFAGDARIRMGVELDRFDRPVAYWLRAHPGDNRWGQRQETRLERVPAEQILHLRLIDRFPQCRGEPWLHTALRKLDDMNEYSAAELAAARASSYYFGTIKTPDADHPLATGTSGAEQQPVMDIEPGVVQQLAPGEEFDFHSPNRPNQALDPFLRHMLREVAAGVGVSYESLSRDYSQSNYSSSRLALLDDRDLWRVLQRWWIRSFREPLHREWLALAVTGRAVASIPVEAYAADPERYEDVVWKPRGWQWVDPTKEVNAYKEAVKAGFVSVTDVIAQTAGGDDIEDVLTKRERELKLMAEYGLKFDTDPASFDEVGRPVATPAPEPPEPPDDDDDGADAAEQPTTRPARVVSFGR